MTGRTGTFAVESDDGQSERLLSGETEIPGPFGTVPESRWGRIYRGEGVPPEFVPEHFTNIQAGLAFARRVLSRDPARNKQIICVTDGEPTAHIDGRELVLIYPPSDKTAMEQPAQGVEAGAQKTEFPVAHAVIPRRCS